MVDQEIHISSHKGPLCTCSGTFAQNASFNIKCTPVHRPVCLFLRACETQLCSAAVALWCQSHWPVCCLVWASFARSVTLHWPAVFSQTSFSYHLSTDWTFPVPLCQASRRLCGSELLTQSGRWLGLQYLFQRLFINLQFHSTVSHPSNLPPSLYPPFPFLQPPTLLLCVSLAFQ